MPQLLNKATKLPIIENKALRGGLKDTIQRYSIYYLFPIFNEDNTVRYTPKISIEHFIEKKEVKQQKPSSIRFHNELFLKEFICELTRAYTMFLKKQHPQLKIFREEGEVFYKGRLMDLLQGINDSYKHELVGGK